MGDLSAEAVAHARANNGRQRMKPEPPAGSIVRDTGGRPWIRETNNSGLPEWVCTFDPDPCTWTALNSLYGPVIVIYTGDGTNPEWVMRTTKQLTQVRCEPNMGCCACGQVSDMDECSDDCPER